MGQVCCKSKNKDGNLENVDNGPVVNRNEEDLDTEELNRIRDALHNNLEIFLLDYILMSVQFFENYERDSEILREKCLEELMLTSHGKKCFYADSLHELVSTRVTFQPKHGAKKNLEELLHPIRIYLTYDNIDAYYEQDMSDTRPKEKPFYKLTVEDCIDNKKKTAGYANLVESESYEDGPKPVLSSSNSFNSNTYNYGLFQTPKNRKSMRFSFRKSKPNKFTETEHRLSMALSNSPKTSAFSKVHPGKKDQNRKDEVIPQYSNYRYTAYEKVLKPKSLEEYRMNDVPQSSTSIPKSCFQKIEQPLYKDKRRLNTASTMPMDAIVSHNVLNSAAFKGHFCDVFYERIAEALDLDSKSMDNARVHGASIICKKNKITYQITPTIEMKSWPDCMTEFMRPVDKDPSQLPWPTIYLQKCVKNQGLSLTPVGYLKFQEENPDYEKEWKIECPKGEKYLLLHLLHAQVRCYLFALALYKSFIEVEDEALSFGPYHLINLLFWEVKKNYLWPEAEPGFTFIRFLNVLYKKLQLRKMRDFFIHQRNLFGSSPAKDIYRVLGRLQLIIENPVPYVLVAIRNLKFKSNFYPKLDCARLFRLATEKDILTFLNPSLAVFRKSVFDEKHEVDNEDNLEEEFEEDKEKFVRKRLRIQIEAERVANELLEQARKSVDSIDVKAALVLDKKAIRRQEILRCFIPHFIEMALKSKEYKALNQCLMYLLHARRLTTLLSEEQIDKSETYRYFERIDSIKMRCEKMKKKLANTNSEENEETGEENKNAERKEEAEVHDVVEIRKKDSSNPEIKKETEEISTTKDSSEKPVLKEETEQISTKEDSAEKSVLKEETVQISTIVKEDPLENYVVKEEDPLGNQQETVEVEIHNIELDSKKEEIVVELTKEEEEVDTKL